MIIKIKNSENYSKKTRKSKDIKLIVIHYTGMQSKIVSIKRLSSLKHKVSCHYLIDRKGEVLKMIQENKVAWHAGKSRWKKFINLNENSIGIELVNKGHEFGYQKFTSNQIRNLIKLCKNIKKKYKIKNSNIVGHSDVAPMRKLDPGEKFPWEKLNSYELGIWYKKSKTKSQILDKKIMTKKFFQNLFKIGYRYFSQSRRNKKDTYIIKAFQRRFNQKNISGLLDEKTYKISHFLAQEIKN